MCRKAIAALVMMPITFTLAVDDAFERATYQLADMQ